MWGVSKRQEQDDGSDAVIGLHFGGNGDTAGNTGKAEKGNKVHCRSCGAGQRPAQAQESVHEKREVLITQFRHTTTQAGTGRQAGLQGTRDNRNKEQTKGVAPAHWEVGT